MPNYAVVKENAIVNVVIADSKEDAELLTNSICVEYTPENPLGIGWLWDGTKFVDNFVKPPQSITSEGTVNETQETTELP